MSSFTKGDIDGRASKAGKQSALIRRLKSIIRETLPICSFSRAELLEFLDIKDIRTFNSRLEKLGILSNKHLTLLDISKLLLFQEKKRIRLLKDKISNELASL